MRDTMGDRARDIALHLTAQAENFRQYQELCASRYVKNLELAFKRLYELTGAHLVEGALYDFWHGEGAAMKRDIEAQDGR